MIAVRAMVAASLILLSGCDAFDRVMYRMFNDPARVIRVTTTSGQIIDLYHPYVDYMFAIGAGRYDRGGFTEGLGLRTPDGILTWAEFKELSIPRGESAVRQPPAEGESLHAAQVRLNDGSMVTRSLRDTNFGGIQGWQKADRPVSSSGYIWTEIPLRAAVRVERLESVWDTVPAARDFPEFRITAQRTSQGLCEGLARMYHPLPVQPGIHASHGDSAIGLRIEDQDVVIEIKLNDMREITVGDRSNGKARASVTLSSGEKRTYTARNAYFAVHGADPTCRRVDLVDLRTITISDVSD